MADQLPEPLVPPDCDLRDFAFMPLDVRRLLTSETWLLGTADEKCAALCLWLESWHQVPAGSLPDNERILAHLSQAGAKWRRVRERALRGWTRCSDGRLYHPVVAEKAREAWGKRLQRRARGMAGALSRWGNDHRASNRTSMPEALAQASKSDGTSIKQAMLGDGKGEGEGEGNREGNREEPSPNGDGARARATPREPDDCEIALRAWNDAAPDLGLRRVQNFHETRRRHLAARLRECGGLEGWGAVLAKIRGSPFLRGQNDRGWRCDFDWVTNRTNFAKVMEGNYDDRGSKTERGVTNPFAIAALERRAAERDGEPHGDWPEP